MVKKTILVTGCSDGGLGAALALALHQSGWRVFATARNPAKMASINLAGIETLTLDVLSEESLSKCVAIVTQLTGGTLDGLVNNAGAGLQMPFADLSIDEGKKLFDLNVWSVAATSQAFLPLLMKAEYGALLVNNTSVAAVSGLPFQAAYNASKAALMMFSQTMRLELAPFGIKVIDLRTAMVASNFYDNSPKNGMSTKLPPNSIYQTAREPVENVLSGVIEGSDGPHNNYRGQKADVWAKRVVADLNKKDPPAVIWRGHMATRVWLGTFLPHGLLESKMKRMTCIDKVEEALRKQTKAK